MTETPQPPQQPPQPPQQPPPAGAPAPAAPAQPQYAGSPGDEYPVTLEIDQQEEYSRFLPLVKWLLLIPHYFCIVFLAIGALFVGIYAAFAILFTRRYPRGAFDYMVGVTRWANRINGYHLLMTDAYPPFSLADDPGHPVRYDVAYPEQGVDRWRPFFAFILAYPYNIVAGALTFAVGFILFIPFFAILFTKKYPDGLFEFALNSYRWQARGNAYATAQTTSYPPWTWG